MLNTSSLHSPYNPYSFLRRLFVFITTYLLFPYSSSGFTYLLEIKAPQNYLTPVSPADSFPVFVVLSRGFARYYKLVCVPYRELRNRDVVDHSHCPYMQVQIQSPDHKSCTRIRCSLWDQDGSDTRTVAYLLVCVCYATSRRCP
jgi:hypothetical protein